MFILAQVPVHGTYDSNLLVGLMPLSIGLGLTFVPLTLLGTSGVENRDAGLASGLFNSSQQVGGSLGLAILATLAADHTASLIHNGAVTHAAQIAARVSGYQVAFTAAAVMMGAGAVLLMVLLRRRHLAGVQVGQPAVPAEAAVPAAA
jgi:hypothetical protein